MPSERPVLVGRARHLQELALLVDAIRAGRGGVVVMSGEAGAGKTRLAEEASIAASVAGVEVAWTTCWSDAGSPLGTWLDLLALVDPTVTPGTHRPGGTDPEAARALLVRSLVSQLRGAIGERPTLLVVDDVQWCDPLSLHAIEALAGSVRTSPIGLVATVRDDGPASVPSLDVLARLGRHLVVPPLTDAELGELAMQVTGRSMTRSAVARLRDRTAGNVLFAYELLTNTEPELDPTLTAGVAGTRGDTMFAGRIASLSDESRKLLLAASVVGRRFGVDVLCEVLHLGADTVLAHLEAARQAGLVRESGVSSYEFSHPLMAEACYASAGFPERVRLHREVGEALERLRTGGRAVAAADLAHHFANAAAAGAADKAVEYAAAAGRESMDQLAYEDAARDYSRALAALDVCTADDARRVDLLLDLGDAYAASGDLPAARAAYERVAPIARQHGWSDRFARAALGVGSGPGGFEVPPFDREQTALLEAAAALADGALRGRVLARLSVALSLDASVERRARLSEEAVSLARDANDTIGLGYALASWCDVVAGPSDAERRLAATPEILECASTAGDTRLELLGRRLKVVALLEVGAIDEVDAEIGAFAGRAEELEQVVYSWYVPLWRAMRAVMAGDLDQGERWRREAIRLGELAHSENAAMLTGSQLAMLRCEVRAADEAIAFFYGIVSRWPDYAIMARPALAYAHGATGSLDRARGVLNAVTLADYTIDSVGSELLSSLAMLAHAAWLTGTNDIADDLYATLLPFRHLWAIDGIGAYNVGCVERPLGLLAALRGERALAAEHLGAALAAHRSVGAHLLVAGTLRDAGSALGDDAALEEATARGPTARGANVFRRDGEVWEIGIDAPTVRVRDTKGMRDLALLLARPGAEVHVLDLVAAGPTVASPSAGDAVDATARRTYRARLLELEHELEETDQQGDVGRSERLHAERDALLAELSGAYGLGGRARPRGDSAERARSAVTQRIRDTITRIEKVAPELGHHLRRSVRTGTYCCYEPEHPTSWEL